MDIHGNRSICDVSLIVLESQLVSQLPEVVQSNWGRCLMLLDSELQQLERAKVKDDQFPSCVVRDLNEKLPG